MGQPTLTRAVLTTLIDLITFGRHYHYDKKTPAFITYEVIHKPLYHLSVIQIHSIYAPPTSRNTDTIHTLLHSLPSETVITDHNVKGSERVGHYYAYRPQVA